MHNVHALVVDDSKVGRMTMSKKLEGMGIQVSLAESGQEALDFLAHTRPDMIFMDHMMPEMDGFEATRRIKSDPLTQDIPVIIVSGNDEAEFVRQARQLGAIDVFAKPPASEALEQLIATLAAQLAPQPAAPSLPAGPDPVHVELGQLRAEFGARQENQAATLEQIERQMGEFVTMDTRLQATELRIQQLESEAARLLPELNTRHLGLEQRFSEKEAQSCDQAKHLEAKSVKLSSRMEGLSADMGRLAGELHLIKAELEMRVGQLEEASVAQQNMRAAFADLSERVSEDRLRQFVVETIEATARNNDAPAVDLAKVQGKLKRLVWLGVLGWVVLFAGLVQLLLR